MSQLEDRYIIPSVIRALQILESFSLDKDTYTNAELSRELNLNKSSMTRLLYSLEKARFIRRDKAAGGYQLTHKAYQIGKVYIQKVDLHTESMPILRELAGKCQEVSHLGILDDMQVLYLDWIEGPQTVSLISFSGRKLPAYCTGIGKNFLAHMQAEELADYLNTYELCRHTENTITKPELLMQQLPQIKKQGYAIDNGELEAEVISISGPVKDKSGQMVAGISVAGPVFRMTDEVLQEKVIPEVIKASREISRRLGWG